MSWNSVSDLPDDIKESLPAPAQELFLKTYNNSQAGKCKGVADTEKCSNNQAWAAVKQLYKTEGARWTSRASIHSIPTKFLIASKNNAHIISGPLIELNKINANKWGIPQEEANQIEAGLIGVPLKICSGPEAIFNEHACDYNWDPGSQIGQVISTHQSAGWIHATARVTDPVAQSKLDSGSWKKNWSIFGGYKFEDPAQMRYGTVPMSVTLVRNPAYTGANFNKQAASKSSRKTEIDSMTGKDETYTQEQVDEQIKAAVEADHATMTKEAETAQTKFNEAETVHQDAIAAQEQAFAASAGKYKQTLEDKDAELKKLQSAGRDHEPDLKDMIPRTEVEDMLAAAAKKSADDMIPRTEVDSMISAAAKKATTDTMDLLQRERLSDEITTLQASHNIIKEDEIPTTRDKLMEKSAASLEQDKDLLIKMSAALETHGKDAVDKFKAANLPASAGSGDGRDFTVGGPSQWGK